MAETDILDVIYFEKQEGQLCAQHCLNNLIQSQMFSALDLAEIAKGLDEHERQLMQPTIAHAESVNYDDSGFFSVQVISKAMECFGLSIVSYGSNYPEAVRARSDPATNAYAYICNLRQHWFTIRKFGPRAWFNLNSIWAHPAYITSTYLSVFLAQLQAEGYSIFVVVGSRQTSAADDFFSVQDISPDILMNIFPQPGNGQNTKERQQIQSIEAEGDDDLRKAIEMSRQAEEMDDQSLLKVLELSRKQAEENEVLKALELSKKDCSEREETAEEQMTRKALEMSRQQALMDTPSTSKAPHLQSTSGQATSNDQQPTTFTTKTPHFQSIPSQVTSNNQELTTSTSELPMDAAALRKKRLEFLSRNADSSAKTN